MHEIWRKPLLKHPEFGTQEMTMTDSIERRPIILCLVAFYLPGYRFGGPVRTIANFVAHLGNEFDIRIVTRDRDALDTQPYPDVEVDKWSTVGKAQVFYASARKMNLRGIVRLIRDTPHDVLYLNSFFAAHFTILPLLARRLGLIPNKPCVIAPRGEFSRGAIALKAWKKWPYVGLSKALGLYADLWWQASSAFEVQDIQRVLSVNADAITIAPDLPPVAAGPAEYVSEAPSRVPGPLRIIFLSRISPVKNLDYLLRVLRRVATPIEFTIYGPLREPDYWETCQSIMTELPGHVVVNYAGEVTPPQVLRTFSAFDLFAFPTRGENYGHVVLEALMAGTALLISDQTPWQASSDKAVEVIPLSIQDVWVRAIERWGAFKESDFQRMRQAAQAYAHNYLDSSGVVQQNRVLFLGVSQSGTVVTARML